MNKQLLSIPSVVCSSSARSVGMKHVTHIHLQEGLTDHADLLQSLRIVGRTVVNSISCLFIIRKVSRNEGSQKLGKFALDLVNGDICAPNDHGGSSFRVFRGWDQFTAWWQCISLGTSNCNLANSLV